MNRKHFLKTLLIAPLAAGLRVSAAGTSVQVYKTPTCGCCGNWVQHLRDHGFQVTVQEVPDTASYRRKFGVPESLASCHTAVLAGYALEGHVPAAEIQRLLKEKPNAKGLAVPGMPAGSPGMEMGTTQQAYSVMLFDAEGASTVYQRYPAR